MPESIALSRLAPPPRTVSPRLAAQMLLGGAGTQTGWLLLAFGSVFFWAFALKADYSGWRFRAGAVERVQGMSQGCEKTGYTEGGSHWDGGTPVYRNLYRYEAAGRSFDGVSYANGRCESGGEAVRVEYLTGDPGFSRIEGMRHGLLSVWAVIGGLFPGVGLVVALAGLVKGGRRLRVLRTGLPAAGRLIEKPVTRSKTNGSPDYRMTFEYTTRDGTAGRLTTRTNRPERLEDQPQELLLYDPEKPAHAFLIDDLPGVVTIDESGQPALSGRAHLFLPVVALIENGWFIYRHWIP